MLIDQTAAVCEDVLRTPMPDAVWQVEVDRATPAEWSQMLDLFDDASLYQTWSYGAVRWGKENLSHLVLKRNNEVVAIAQLRIVRPTKLKFGIAYLRWGPLFQRRGGELDIQAIQRMARSLEAEYVSKIRLLLKVVPNGFEGSSRAEVFQSAFSNFKTEFRTAHNTYRTSLLDLSPPIEQLRKNFDKKWRNQLTTAEKNGLTVVVGTGKKEFRTFCDMYREMRNRKTFDTTVNILEFEQIREALPEHHRFRILICKQDAIPVAGLVASAMGDSAIYLLGATSDAGLKAKGSYLLHWKLIQSLKENCVKFYDLGGIDPEGNPGVYHFKRGFSGSDVTQLVPFVKCGSVLSSALIRTSLALHDAIRGVRGLRFPKPLSRALEGK